VAWMSLLPDHSDYLARILGPMLVIAADIGLMLLPLAASATAGIETRYAGLASGLFNTARQPRGRHRPRLPHRPAHLRSRQPGLGPHRPPPAHPSQDCPGHPHRAPSAYRRRKEMTTKHYDHKQPVRITRILLGRNVMSSALETLRRNLSQGGTDPSCWLTLSTSHSVDPLDGDLVTVDDVHDPVLADPQPVIPAPVESL